MPPTDEQIRAMMRDTSKYPPSARHLGMEVLEFSFEGSWAEVAFNPRTRRARNDRQFDEPTRRNQGQRDCNAVLRFVIAPDRRRRAVGAHRAA